MFRSDKSGRRVAARPTPAGLAAPAGVRLQKAMASAGVGSRRHCEELITAGRVEIDGRVVTELGTRVAPGQTIRLDGTPLATSRLVYYLVHKPVGFVCTNFDPSGRPRVLDLLPAARERLFTVGRLDMSSEGLMLVTNDGELANRLSHPRFGVEKTYLVLVAGAADSAVLDQLREGVHLAEGFVKVVSVRVKTSHKQSTMLEIVLNEGKNREIRRLLAKLGHKVLQLRRTAIGPLRLKDLAPGEHRRPTGDELRLLRSAASGARTTRGGKRPRSAKPRRPETPRPAATLDGATLDRATPRGARRPRGTPSVAPPAGPRQHKRGAIAGIGRPRRAKVPRGPAGRPPGKRHATR